MGKYRALIKRLFVQHTGWLNLLRLLNSTSVYDCPNLLPLNKNVLFTDMTAELQIQLVPFNIGTC
jgi:hypothetical protein